MAVPSVFISSTIRGLEPIRAGAARAVERMHMHPVLVERLAADPAAARRALLDEVAMADYFLLILGPRYGDEAEGGRSPTEDEYEEAVRRHKPLIVLVQEVELEPDQRQFLERIRGSWAEGVLYDTFSGSADVGEVVAAALARRRSEVVEDPQAAAQRATELARGDQRTGMVASGVEARIACVPLRTFVMLDAVALEEPGLIDGLAASARAAGVVPQHIGIKGNITADVVSLEGTDTDDWTKPQMRVGADGSILVVGSVRGGGPFAGSLVEPVRLEGLLRSTGRFAMRVWDRLDAGGEIERVAMTAAIPDAQYKGFGSISGGSMGMGHGTPDTVVAQPVQIVPRGQVGDDRVVRALVASVRRVFADAGAIHE